MVRFYTFYIIIFIAVINSCSIIKKKGITEKIIDLKSQDDPSVIIALENGEVYLDKDKVLKLLDSELNKDLNNQIKSDKEELYRFLSEKIETYRITENDVAHFSGILSVLDKLMKKGEVNIITSSGEKADKIKLKEMHGLYGSYTRSYALLDDTELITTYAEFGE